MPAQQIKKYVFGYGSLVSHMDLRRTLKHPVDTVHPATLNGWSREWGIILDNAKLSRSYELVDGTFPNYVAVLNIFKPSVGEKPTNPNGVLFEVSDEDLKSLDARESHYYRADVTEDIEADVAGTVYAYIGLDKYRTLDKHSDETILAQSYVDIVDSGFNSIGDKDAETFKSTTIVSRLQTKPTIHRG